MESRTSLNRLALSATAHCLTGCAIGEVLGVVIGTALGWGNRSRRPSAQRGTCRWLGSASGVPPARARVKR